MERQRAQTLVGAAMVLPGVVQAAFGLRQGTPVYAALGVGLAVLGVAYVRFEACAAEG